MWSNVGMKNRNVLIGLSAVVVVLLFLGYSAYRQKQWAESHFAGTVVSISAEEFTIVDPHSGTTSVRLHPDVTIVQGRSSRQAPLRLGDSVMVVGEMSGTSIEPKVIRIFNPDERNEM